MSNRKNKDYKRDLSDLRKFLAIHYENIQKRKITLGKIGLFVSLGGVILCIFSFSQIIIFCLSAIVALIGFVFSVLQFRISSDPFENFNIETSNKKYTIEVMSGVMLEGNFVLFNQLKPSVEEEENGFKIINTENLCNNVAFSSETLDNQLILTDNIHVNEDIQKVHFVSNHHELRNEQLTYLVTRVGHKENITFNGRKICFESSISDLLSSCSGNNSVQINEVGYFDGLITNEAFRSQILEENKNTGIKKVFKNLTINFPALRENDGIYHLASQPSSGISRHIGISTIALTSDSQIVFFRQKSSNAIGSGMLVASGSGSSDIEDIVNCGKSDDLKSIIQFSMARELVEESGIYDKLKEKEVIPKIQNLAKNTMMTGFFRWVDRSGKPEFIGISKLNIPACDIPGDDYEITKEIEDSSIFKKKIRTLSDFSEFKEKLQLVKNNQLNLSFYVAIHRLTEIASYEKSDDQIKKETFELVNNFLFE